MVKEATDSQPNSPSGPPPARGRSTFSSLKYPNYRLLWLAQIGRTAAMWMEQIARPVLILQLTDSPLQVGLVVAARMAPQLILGLLAGVVADRWDRKRVLLAAQAVTTSTHFILGALVLAGVVEPWHVFALAFVTGSALVFNQTSRSSLIPSLVPKDEVLNAVALNTTALNLMRILGPALAGVLLLWGISPVYFVSGILGIWGIIFVSFMEIRFEPRKTEDQTGWLEDLRAGLRFMMDNPAIIAVLGPPLIMFVFGIPYLNVFVPLFAKDVLDLGDSGVGALVAAAGAGALVGSLFIASQRNLKRQGLLLVLFIALFASALIVFSRTTYLPLSIVALMAAASMSTCYMALTNSLLLNMSPPNMHGRVISLMSLDRGLIPAGAALAGALAAKMGPQDGLFVMASICLVLAVLAGLFATPLRRL